MTETRAATMGGMAETRAKSIEELMAESTAKLDAILSMVTKLTQSQLITAVEIAPPLQQSTESGQEKYVGTYFWRQQQAWEKNVVAKGDPSLPSSNAPVAAAESGLRAVIFGEQGLKQPVHSAPLLPFYTTSGFNSSRTYPDSLILPNQSDTFADIFPVPLGAQIVHLTASGNVEEALASCKLLPPEDASLRAAKEDDMDQSPPSHIVDSKEHSSLECRKMNHNTLMAPVRFLQKKRPSIIERATAEGTEEVVLDAVGDRFRKSNKGRGNISIGSAAREMAAILDTALLQALLLTGQFSASLKLLKVLNYCDVRICEEILRGEQIEERIMDPGSPAVLIVSPFDVLIFKILNYKSTRKKLYYKPPQLCIFMDGSELIKTLQRGISNASRKEEGKGEECSSSPVGKNSGLPHIRSAGLSEDKATLRGEHITSGVVIKNLNAEVVKAVMLADSAQVCEDTIHHGKDNVCGLDVSAGVKENVPSSEDGNHILLSVKISVIVARHEALESLQLGPDFCERITSDAIKMIALCCHRLRKLRLSGIRDVNGEAINSLAELCPNMTDIGFIDFLNVDGMALGNVISVRFLSVAGTSNMKWGAVSHRWYKLSILIGLDVSRTDIGPIAVSKLLSSSQSLKVLCELDCLVLEEDSNFDVEKYKGKLVLALFTDIFKGISSLFVDTAKSGNNVFFEWRSSTYKCKNLDEIMTWLEWILSHSLLRIAETNQHGLDAFWLNQGAPLLLSLIQSLQEDVQERATTGLATFVVTDDENANIDWRRAEAVMHGGGIRLLLYLAKSWREGLQSEAAKAIANLSVNPHVAKAVAEEGGTDILASLARSMYRLVAEEAAGGLWNLSVGEDHKGSIAEAGGGIVMGRILLLSKILSLKTRIF